MKVQYCKACVNAFIGSENTNPEPAQWGHEFCGRCRQTAQVINGIQHRMNQQPDANYIFVPREWLTLLMDVVNERSRAEFTTLLVK